VRKEVARHLRILSNSLVLDVLFGEGDFARAVAKSSKQTRVIAGEILGSDLQEAKHRIERDKLKDRVRLLRMDVTFMAFADNSFDYVVNFTGWEDFTAISGEESIDKAFSEMTRVLKANGILATTFIPLLEATDEVSRRDKELREYMYTSGKRPSFFEENFFLQMLERHGVKLAEKMGFETSKSRLKPQDAKEFLEWFCQNYRSFYAPDVEMRTYEEIIRKFGKFIEKHGVREVRSEFVLLIGKKLG
jgi:cyclopropane fatty-acyl-phospholipid synthase-like methyltransferase